MGQLLKLKETVSAKNPAKPGGYETKISILKLN